MEALKIPKEMKAVQIVEFNKPYQLNTVAVPTSLGEHDLLVKVAVASYCHTDSMVHAGKFVQPRLPMTASHEGAGTVVAVGAAVTASAFKPGDRVMCGLPMHACGACDDCAGPDESRRQYCAHMAGHVGTHLDGCLAEYVVVDGRSTTRLPDAVGFRAAAPLACAGRTAWRAVQMTELRAGQWIALVGAGGGLGHLAIQFAKKAMGLRVVGVEARDAGLEMARESGADVVVDARRGQEQVVAEVRALTAAGADAGVDATVVLSDAAGTTALACALTRMHGMVVQVGLPAEVKIPFQELLFRDIRVRGMLLCSPRESEAMVRAVAEHDIRVETTAFDGLDKMGELAELVHGGTMRGKAVVVVDAEQL